MKTILSFIILAVGLLTVGLALVCLAVLAATGIGWLLSRILPFNLYEATVLSLIALLMLFYLAVQLFKDISVTYSDDSDGEEDDTWEDEEEAEDEDEDKKEFVASIPRWRQPLKRLDRFANARPDDRCPCGSGKKYKNCHGRGK